MIVKFMEKQDQDFVMRIDKHIDDAGYHKRVYTKTGSASCHKCQQATTLV